MDYLEQERRTKTGDVSPEAIHCRLVAIRKMTGLTSKELAASAGIKYTTFISQEKAGSPSVKLMTYYLKAFLVDYNFILGGDAARLPADVREAILVQLGESSAT
ncbi:helix-turn-helix transcriptional regulator [uncultured Ruegeria sp.]|uniref:helix-turn-helix domain-containing protein n=1 Tax=uncultured Ruegeria sp. TaxID=259304 RepID=UPI0026349544|nr:helix-turn-helix transcriptional regulator [uncultured Ruegeria sp.]